MQEHLQCKYDRPYIFDDGSCSDDRVLGGVPAAEGGGEGQLLPALHHPAPRLNQVNRFVFISVKVFKLSNPVLLVLINFQ